jgi:hypothetical protein
MQQLDGRERTWCLSHRTYNVKTVLKFKEGPKNDHQQQRYYVYLVLGLPVLVQVLLVLVLVPTSTSIATGDMCLSAGVSSQKRLY